MSKDKTLYKYVGRFGAIEVQAGPKHVIRCVRGEAKYLPPQVAEALLQRNPRDWKKVTEKPETPAQ